jgi:tetratricopeptide (TPR) repeat protein
VALPCPSLGTLFKGRDAVLARIHDAVRRGGGFGAPMAAQVIEGMGGIGKTRAAVEYAWAYQNDYTALVLIDAETPGKLEAGIAALAGPLRLAEHSSAEQAVKVEAALAWLDANPGWLLILDNVDTDAAAVAAGRLLGRLAGGHVLLTSRRHGFAPGVEPIALDVLALPDAAALLLEQTVGARRAIPNDPAEAIALASELGRLPLALELAAATIRARKCSFADYRRLWREDRAALTGPNEPGIATYGRNFDRTLLGAVELLPAEARALLERLAFFAPDPLPVSLLDVQVPNGATAEATREALNDLASHALADRAPDGASLAIHPLVQDATRRSLDSATASRRLGEALGWIDAAFEGDPGDPRTWPILDPLAPHADAVVARADAAGIADPTGRLMSALGTLFQAKAQYARSEPLLRRALAIDEASLGKDHPNFARDLNNLAGLLQDTNRLGEAEPLMRRALAIDEASLGKDHPTVAIRLNNLAQLLQATNRLGEAEPLMRHALAIDEASLGKDHPDVARDLNNLAALLQDTNRLGEAEPLMRRALAIDEASLGKDHPNVAIDLNNLARLLHATNRLGEAEPLMRRALAIDEASFGKDHPNVATALNNLAQLLQATNRLGEAEPLMRRALAIFLAFQRDTGHAHPTTTRRP